MHPIRLRRAPALSVRILACLLWWGACMGSATAAAPAAAPSPPIAVPARHSLVTDTTGALTPAQQAALREKLEDVHARLGPQLAVLVVPTTNPEDIDAYATRVFAQW